MAQDPSHFLNELPIWKLKMVAAEFKVDVSGCRYKRDFVEKIRAKRLTEEQVRGALAWAGKAGPEEGPQAKEITDEIEAISKRPAGAPELPADEEAKVERHIDEALMMKPVFFEVDSTTENALNKMIIGDFAGAMKANREARMKCLNNFSQYQVYSTAISVRAADELIAKLPEDKGRLDPTLRTALAAAKRAFISGSPRQREETLESIETLAAKAFEACTAESEKEEAELKQLLADYESFGTRTEEARRYLEIAFAAKQALNFAEHSKHIEAARQHAEAAKEARKEEIENTFPLVKAAAAEAQEVGVEVSHVEAKLDEAREAFDGGSFRQSVELLAAIERQVDEAHLQQLRSQKDLEAKQTEKTRTLLITYEPVIQEGMSYGLGLQEGLHHVANAKSALSRRDIVNAAKYMRRVKDIAVGAEKALDKKRVELGVVRRLEDAKCGKCGKKALYVYPNETQKCMECGHTYSVAPPPQGPSSTPPTPVQEPAREQQQAPASPAPPAQPSQEAPQVAKKKRKLLKWQ